MIATIDLAECKQTLKPLVQYYDIHATHTVAPGERVHDYYGVPDWLMADYLARLGATAVGDRLFQRGQCWMELAPAAPKCIGSLVIGGSTVEFTCAASAIQELLAELEWRTLRCC